MFRGELLAWLALGGETLITAVTHFSWALIDSPCTKDGWVTITPVKTSHPLTGGTGALHEIIFRTFFKIAVFREELSPPLCCFHYLLITVHYRGASCTAIFFSFFFGP